MADRQLPIILFCYAGSVYSRRISWYLDLRHIPYATSIQPPQLPRPLIHTTLHLSYRRIPILAIGRSILCDTRLILAKLEALFPPSPQHPPLLPTTTTTTTTTGSPERRAAAWQTAKLLERWTTGPDVFFAAVGLIPASMPLLRDPAFVADRLELAGGNGGFGQADRGECWARIEAAMAELESGFLSGGTEEGEDKKKWILGRDDGPTLCDLQGVWVFDWLLSDPFLEGALADAGGVEALERRFPRTVAWVRRWREWLREKGAWDHEREGPRSNAIGDEEVVEKVFGAKQWVEEEVVWDRACAEVLGLEKGQRVEVHATDYGSSHKDRGKLAGLAVDEVVIEVEVAERGKTLRVHFPRTGFRVQKVE